MKSKEKMYKILTAILLTLTVITIILFILSKTKKNKVVTEKVPQPVIYEDENVQVRYKTQKELDEDNRKSKKNTTTLKNIDITMNQIK